MSEDKSFKNIIIGFVIGVASILPGVSGGLIAVVYGVYERLVKDIGDIWHKWIPEFWFLLTLGSGILLGMFVTAIGLNAVLGTYLIPSMFLFMGLILAQVPEVYKIAKDGKPMKAWYAVSFIAGVLIMVLFLVIGTGEANAQPMDHTWQNAVLLVVVGIILAISKIAPGISGSSVLLAIGLFQVMTNAMAHFDLYFLIPLGIGLVIGLFGFAKVMTYLLDNYRSMTYYCILGLTIGSLFVIFPGIGSLTDAVIAVAAFAVGVGISYLFNLYGKRAGATA